MKTREGFVLPGVIFALAIMGLLAVVSLRTANDEHRSSRALRKSGAALYAAEAGANMVRGTVTDTFGTTLADSITAVLAPGDHADLGWKALPDGGSYRVVILRTDEGIPVKAFTLTAEGLGAGLWGGRRAITMALTGATLSLPIVSSALGSVDGTAVPPFEVTLNGSSYMVEGKDTQMPSASDPANLPAGCSATPTTENKTGFGLSSPEAQTIFEAEAGTSDHALRFRGLTPGSSTNQYQVSDSWDTTTTSSPAELQALVDALTPGATLLPPNTTIDYDLGTPAAPGVFLVDGSISFKADGYGILIVTGDFLMNGNGSWEGLILVVGTGSISFTGAGNKVFGAVIGVNTQGGSTSLYVAGNAEVYYSSQALCRIEQSGLLAVGGVTLVSGSWMQLSL